MLLQHLRADGFSEDSLTTDALVRVLRDAIRCGELVRYTPLIMHDFLFLILKLRWDTHPFYLTTPIDSSWFSKRVLSACSSSCFHLSKPTCCPAHGAAASAACTRSFPCHSPSDLCQNTSASSCSLAKLVYKSIETLVGSAFCFLRAFPLGNASTPTTPAIRTQSRFALCCPMKIRCHSPT
jgi:hypothetical protein